MGNIHIMSSELVGRIAAGEVVERPASVVKELVENSIDAGATQIRVNIEGGGQKLIQVIDNGHGMDRADATLCLETHATSKISCDGDVGHIATLGFRGEAIPSIASVSRFLLQTRRAEDAAGTEIAVEFGSIRDLRDCGCAVGTNIRVSQLFGNLPARRKFMRGPETEDGYIEEMLRMLALSRPEISMSLRLNNREAIQSIGTNDLGMRVSSLLGRDVFASMLPLDYSEDGVYVRGFVTKPGYTRSSRREQRVIVNGRAASAEIIYFALRDAFDTLIMKGRYPGAVIYIDLAPDRVDVNVHPTKREVRFREPRQISQIVGAAIRKALRGMSGGEDVPVYMDNSPLVVQPPPQVIEELPFNPPKAPEPIQPPTIQQGLPLNVPPAPRPIESVASVPVGETKAQVAQTPPRPAQSTIGALKLIGRLGTMYALAESGNGLVVVNLKAAHQRIVFERLLATASDKEVSQQQLLIPTTLTLSPDEVRFMKQELAYFLKLGFGIEAFGGNSFIVSAVPASFPNQDVGRMIRDMIDELRSSSVTNRQSVIHLAQVACRCAISANAPVSDGEVATILSDLAKTEMPYVCPNGHPTMVHITYGELEKRFSS